MDGTFSLFVTSVASLMKNLTIGVPCQIWQPGKLNKNHIHKKEGKNEKDLYIHTNFDGTDSLYVISGPDI